VEPTIEIFVFYNTVNGRGLQSFNNANDVFISTQLPLSGVLGIDTSKETSQGLMQQMSVVNAPTLVFAWYTGGGDYRTIVRITGEASKQQIENTLHRIYNEEFGPVGPDPQNQGQNPVLISGDSDIFSLGAGFGNIGVPGSGKFWLTLFLIWAGVQYARNQNVI